MAEGPQGEAMTDDLATLFAKVQAWNRGEYPDEVTVEDYDTAVDLLAEVEGALRSILVAARPSLPPPEPPDPAFGTHLREAWDILRGSGDAASPPPALDLCATCGHSIQEHSGQPDKANDACARPRCHCPRMVRTVGVASPPPAPGEPRPGWLVVDGQMGHRTFHIEGPMGLHPEGIAAIQRAIYAALDEHERQDAQLAAPPGAVPARQDKPA